MYHKIGRLQYHTVCRVGVGFSFTELKEFRLKLEAVKQPWVGHKDCTFMAPWKPSKKDDIPDFFIPPEDSFVVQVKCAELVPSISVESLLIL